jgi:hypothetical protein
MNAIQKITVSYVEQEDRLHFACEDAGGQVQSLWLTQRLTNRLAVALLSQLDGTMAHLPSGARETFQGWEQSAARALLSPSSPVQSVAAVAYGLVNSIDISHTDGSFTLVFRWPEQNALAVTMNALPLRQWLSIIQETYVKAGWPLEIWPVWIRESVLPVQGQGAALH